MIPSRLLLWLSAALALLAIPLVWLPGLQLFWYALALLLALGVLLDYVLSYSAPALEIERDVPGVWAVGRWHDVRLTLHNRGRRRLRLHVFDGYPDGWEIRQLPHYCRVDAGHFLQFSYQLRPTERGDGRFDALHLRVISLLGLWQFAHRIGQGQTVKVFPDYAQLFGQQLAAADRQAPSAGMIRKRRRGEGTDFRQLREYRSGDSERAIDWKASARMQKLITREYQEERDQQVVILLDTGRRLLAKDDTTSHFDHALHAVLTLAFIAQRQGDAVGLMTFGGHERWLAPAKGRAGLDRLMANTYDLQAQEVAPDYLLAATRLLEKIRKRAFIVLITNLRDEDDHALRSAIELMSQRHLVMCASLRERALEQALDTPVHGFEQALRLSGTAHYMQQRREAIQKLGIRAGQLIDTTPERLGPELIRHYMDIKESGQL